MGNRNSARRFWALGVLLAAGTGPGVGTAAAFLPYRMMLEVARSPEKPLVFVQDKVLRVRLRAALLKAEAGDPLAVSPYVYGGHAYLVGWVKDAAERTSLQEAARGVPGLGSISAYLPVKPSGAEAPSKTDELTLKAKVMEAITLQSKAHRMNVTVDVLGTHVVLVGAVASAEAAQSAGEAAQNTSGVSGVTSFLSVPPPSDKKMLGGILSGDGVLR